jgi:hypothetical protein
MHGETRHSKRRQCWSSELCAHHRADKKSASRGRPRIGSEIRPSFLLYKAFASRTVSWWAEVTIGKDGRGRSSVEWAGMERRAEANDGHLRETSTGQHVNH